MANKEIVENSDRVKRQVKPLITVDWTSTAGMTPYYDYERKGYSVAVELSYESASPTSRFKKKAYPSEYINAGVNKIVKYYNKEQVDDPLEIGEAVTYHVPPRPRAKIKVLITIPEDKFLSLAENKKIITSSTKEIQLDTLNLDKKINGIYKLLLRYYEEEKKFVGKVYGFDFKDEADNFNLFLPTLKTLASANGYEISTTNSQIYKIGVNNQYDIEYVQTYYNEEYKDLKVNFGAFKEDPVVLNKQSIYMIDRMKEIYGSSKSNPPLNWETFLKKFTVPGKPYRIEHGENRTYSKKMPSIMDTLNESMNRQPVRTKKELDKDKENLKDPVLQSSAAQARKKFANNVENGILNNLKAVENALYKADLDSLYGDFIHRYQIEPLIRQVIICADPTGSIARKYAQIKRVLREANQFIEGVVEMLKIPNFEIPTFGLTVDMMGDIFLSILKAIGQALLDALLTLLRDIVRMLVESCGRVEDMQFGSFNVKELLDNPAVIGSIMLDRAKKATLSGVEAGILNISSGELGQAGITVMNNIRSFVSTEDFQRLANAGAFDPDGDFSRFLDEISFVSTPGEMINFMRGASNPQMIESIKSGLLSSNRYSEDFKRLLSRGDIISEIGKSFGDLIDDDVLIESLEKFQLDPWYPWNGLCDDNDSEKRKEELLKLKGLSRQEIDKQISEADELRRKRISELGNLLDKDNLLDGVLPAPYCSLDKNGNVIPGLTQLDHPTFDYTLDRTLNTVFDGIYVQFNREIDGFVPSLKQNVSDGFEEIPRVILKENWQDIEDFNRDKDEATEPLESYFMINPKFEMYKGQGYQSKQPYPSQYKILPDNDIAQSIFGFLPWALAGTDVRGDIAGGDKSNSTKSTDTVTINPDNIKKFATGINPDGEALFMHFSKFPSGLPHFSKKGPLSPTEFNILVPKQSNKVAPGLQDNLTNLSLTSSQNSNLIFGDKKTSFVIPNLAMQFLTNNLNPSAGSSGVNTEDALRRMANSINSAGINLGPDRWEVVYEPQTSVSDYDPSKETFSLNIVSYKNETPIPLYAGREKSVTRPINKQALNLINKLDLRNSTFDQNKVNQENIFNALVNDVFVNGALKTSKNEDINTSPDRMNIFTSTNYSNYPRVGKNRVLPNGAGTGLDILNELKLNQTPELQTLYKELLRDFITSFSAEISKSDFFKENFLDLVNFTPYISQEKILEARQNGKECPDPHLLNIDGIKKIVKQNYDLKKCIESVQPNVTGIGSNRENALESSIIQGAVVLTMRIYVMEYLLKSMWAFSEFNFDNDEDVDYTFVTILRNKMISEIAKRTSSNTPYITDFTNEVVKIYQQLRNFPPYSSKWPRLTIDPTEPLVTSLQGNFKLSDPATVAYDFLLKEEINNMMKKVNVILGDYQTDKRISTVLVDSMIPLVDVQVNVGDNVYNQQEVKFLNQLNEYEQQLLDRGLDRATIAQKGRQYLGEEDEIATYEDIIRSLGENANLQSSLGTQLLHLPIYKNRRGQTYPEDINSWKTNSYTTEQNPSTAPAQTFPNSSFFGATGVVKIISDNVGHFLAPIPAIDNNGDILSDEYSPLPFDKSGKYSSWNSLIKPPTISEQSWSENGIKSSDIWIDSISHNELSGTIKLFELLNNPNALPIGNAGQSFTVPVLSDARSTTEKYEYYEETTNYGGEEVTHILPLYRKLELPYAAKTLNTQDIGGFNGMVGAETYPFLSTNLPWLVGGIGYYIDINRTQRLISATNRSPSEIIWQTNYTDNERNGTRPISIATKRGVVLGTNASFGSERLAEFQFDYTMKSWSIIDATVETLPSDISKEINYYSRMKSIINDTPDANISPDNSRDRQFYKLLKRQFLQNRAVWRITRSEMIRLDKVIDEYDSRGTWHGREVPSFIQLARLVEELHYFQFGGKGTIKLTQDYKDQENTTDNYRSNVGADFIRQLENSTRSGPEDPSTFNCPFSFVYILDQISHCVQKIEDGGSFDTWEGFLNNTFDDNRSDVSGDYLSVPTSYRALCDRPEDIDFGWPMTPPSTPGDPQWMPRLLVRQDREALRLPNMQRKQGSGVNDYVQVNMEDLHNSMPNPPTISTPSNSRYGKYFVYWELDWWLSKLTSFMLLSDDFKEHRKIKDYIEYLEELREVVKEVRDNFQQDVRDRRSAREEVEQQLGGLLKTRQLKGRPLTTFMGNGNIVLERYVKIIDRDWDELLEAANQTGDPNIIDNYQSLKDIIANRPPSLQGVVNMEHFQQWVNSVYDAMEQQGLNTSTSVRPSPRPFFYREQPPEKGCGDNLIQRIETLEDAPDIGELFEELSVGVRLTLVSSEDQNPNNSTLILSPNDNSYPLINKVYDQAENNTDFYRACLRDKAYAHAESVTGIDATDLSEKITDDDVKRYVSIPFAFSEYKIDLSSTSLRDLAGSVGIRDPISGEIAVTRSKMEHVFNVNYQKIRCNLLESDEFALMFKYLIPINRIFSLNCLYMQTYMTNFAAADRALNGSKESAKMIFLNAINSGDYRYSDPYDNRVISGIDVTQPDNDWGDYLLTYAAKFPLMVLKALGELTDPNIKLTRRLYETIIEGLELLNRQQNQGLDPNCDDLKDYTDILKPGTFAALSLIGLAPVNIWGPAGYGPPISPIGLAYDAVFGVVDPLENKTFKDLNRLASKCNDETDRDFTVSEECSDELQTPEYLSICDTDPEEE